MKLILLGAPGAGKGTQAQLLSERLGIPAISTGNMLREAMANGSELGEKVRVYMDNGLYVSDEIILELVRERTERSDCKNGFILDGVPRTLVQAQALSKEAIKIDYVVSIEIDDEVIVNRMSGRRVCTKCGASYHLQSNPPKSEGTCDLCGGKVATRKDDAPETVRNRLGIYHRTTEILKDYYRKKGKLRLIPGNQSIEGTFHDILRAIGETV